MTSTIHCIIASVSAGCFSTVLGHPLDTIKVHQQTKLQNSRTSFLRDVKVLADGNALRLFKGIGPPMANQIIMNSIMFSVFNKVKQEANESPILGENSSSLFAGFFSGIVTACISTPTDFVKIQAQLSLRKEGGRHTDLASIFRRIAFRDGRFQIHNAIRTLYCGHVANLGREGVFTMVYLGLYDRISNTVKNRKQIDDRGQLSVGDIMVISSFTGACAWIGNYPFDTVKSVMQANATQNITIKSAIQSIHKSGGFKAFFRGVGSSTFRAMLVTSSRMLAYEKTIQALS